MRDLFVLGHLPFQAVSLEGGAFTRGAPLFFALLRSNYSRRGIHLFINHDKDAFYDPPVS